MVTSSEAVTLRSLRASTARTCVYDGHGPKEFVIEVPNDHGDGTPEIKSSFDIEANTGADLLARLESSRARLQSLTTSELLTRVAKEPSGWGSSGWKPERKTEGRRIALDPSIGATAKLPYTIRTQSDL